jgi:membrane complex biogenesis BtpA family protein
VSVAALRLVGVVHLPPLPGSPRASESGTEIARRAADDARALAKAGFDAVIVENFGDAPFFAVRVPPVTVAAMTACAMAVRDACPGLALGVNVLRNDAEAALGIAAVVGAAFIRVNVHAGARVTDQGIVEGRAAETMRARTALRAGAVGVWADVDVKHSAPIASRPDRTSAAGAAAWSMAAVAREAEDLVVRALADAVLVTGEGTGRAADVDKLRVVRDAVNGRAPVLVASGVTESTLGEIAPLCDGVIVGSALREGGVAGGAVDPGRASRFAEAFRRHRSTGRQ